MSRWLVVGANGMLGQDMMATIRAHEGEAIGADLSGDLTIDITNYDSVASVLNEVKPDVVVNCAAWTAVDDAEDHEATAFTINAVGPANLARVCHEIGARLVQISTDYVFDGTGSDGAPYAADAVIAPQSAYGRTKAGGEWAVTANTDNYLIVRTAWLYGAGGPNFPKTMTRLADSRDHLTVVSDQVGQPTWTRDLAELIVALVDTGAPSGVYHGTSSGAVSWHGFAETILADKNVTVEPVTSAAFAAKAPRPAYSVLSHDTLHDVGVQPIGDWSERWAEAAPEVLGAV